LRLLVWDNGAGYLSLSTVHWVFAQAHTLGAVVTAVAQAGLRVTHLAQVLGSDRETF
jgi:hypothetical protein